MRTANIKRLTPFLIVFFSLMFISFNITAETRFGDISISAKPVASAGKDTYHGYIDQGFIITNHSPSEFYKVRLINPEKSYHYNYGISKNSVSVLVGPSSTVEVSLMQPPLPTNGNNHVMVLINDKVQDGSVNLGHVRHASNPYNFQKKKIMLISRKVNSYDLKIELEKLEEDIKAAKTIETEFHIAAEQSQTESWSENWLSYTSYDCIIVTSDDMESMPVTVRPALRQYMECGGVIVILGKYQIPGDWKLEAKIKKEEELTTILTGFGVCFIKEDSSTPLNIKQLKVINEEMDKGSIPWQQKIALDEANKSFPVVDKISVPVRGSVLLMLLFAAIAGPVNLVVLARKNKRIWLLWTVPLISLATCGTVFIYSLAAEGISPYVRTEGLTILDQPNGRAVTLGWTAFYCPLTPAGGLHFNYKTELTLPVNYYNLGKVKRTIDWTVDQHLQSGWVTSRVPSHFMVRKSEKRRERLQLLNETDGSISVVNGLGAGITQLWLCNSKGNLYYSSDIPSGKNTVMNFKGKNPPIVRKESIFRNIFTSGNWVSSFALLTGNPPKSLSPNTYIAILDSSPFIENGLGNTGENRFRSVVYGILNERHEKE